MSNGFNVLDMAQAYADANSESAKDLFKKPDPVEELKDEIKPDNDNIKPVKKPWTPDASLLEGMDEMTAPQVTYSKDEIKGDEIQPLQNIVDEEAKNEARETMDDMSRKVANIEEAKMRHGIKHLRIPEGAYQVAILNAASDPNRNKSQVALDEIFEDMKKNNPEFILDWEKDEVPDNEDVVPASAEEPKQEDNTNKETLNHAKKEDQIKSTYESPTIEETDPSEIDEKDVKVVIDKQNINQISWTQDEVEKIRKSRTIELNIIESTNIDYANVEDAEGSNVIDLLLAPYQKRSNDVDGALPASKYRATFTGLPYTEVIDLSNSSELNNLDGELKKWTICFNHIKNPSIGPWEEYVLYTDPVTKRQAKASLTDNIPDGVNESTIHHVTKFEDFLRKTSFVDLEFMLWKILCASTMDQEIIQIDCHSFMDAAKTKKCNNHYDWIYSPKELLDMESINPAVLEEIKKTATVTGDDIMANYNSSMLRLDNVATLHSSGIKVVFGHISAYDYLYSVYEKIQEVQNIDDEEPMNDPELASKSLNYTILTAVKSFLIPKGDGKYIRISGADNILKVIKTLDEIDWQTLGQLVSLMMAPYEFTYSMRNLICPKCKNKSSIQIDSIARLLFIVARSLSSVNVTLKRI